MAGPLGESWISSMPAVPLSMLMIYLSFGSTAGSRCSFYVDAVPIREEDYWISLHLLSFISSNVDFPLANSSIILASLSNLA